MGPHRAGFRRDRRWGERWEMLRGVRQTREGLVGLREKFSFYW